MAKVSMALLLGVLCVNAARDVGDARIGHAASDAPGATPTEQKPLALPAAMAAHAVP